MEAMKSSTVLLPRSRSKLPSQPFGKLGGELGAVEAVDPDGLGHLAAVEAGDVGQVDPALGADHDELAVAAESEGVRGHCGCSLVADPAGGGFGKSLATS